MIVTSSRKCVGPRHIGNRGSIALAKLGSAPCPYSSPRSRYADEATESEFLRRRVAKSSGSIPQKCPGSKKRASANDDKSAHGCRPDFPDQVTRDLLERDSGNSGETKSAKQSSDIIAWQTPFQLDARRMPPSARAKVRPTGFAPANEPKGGTSNPKIEFADLKSQLIGC